MATRFSVQLVERWKSKELRFFFVCFCWITWASGTAFDSTSNCQVCNTLLKEEVEIIFRLKTKNKNTFEWMHEHHELVLQESITMNLEYLQAEISTLIKRFFLKKIRFMIFCLLKHHSRLRWMHLSPNDRALERHRFELHNCHYRDDSPTI